MGGSSKVTAPACWGDRYPADSMARMAMHTMAHLIPDGAEQAALKAGIGPAGDADGSG